MGEAKRKALIRSHEPIALDTFGGRVPVEWDPLAAVTPLGQLPFFIGFLKVSGLFDAFVEIAHLSSRATTPRTNARCSLPSCPQSWPVITAMPTSARCATITCIRRRSGCRRFISQDAADAHRIDEAEGMAWLDRHLHRAT